MAAPPKLTLAFSLLLLTLAAPVPASADPLDAVDTPPVADTDVPVEGLLLEAVEAALRDLQRHFGPVRPGQVADVRTGDVEIRFECTPLQSGAQQCTGVVCWTDSGEGERQVSPGRPEEGLYGVGVALEDEDGDGWYGPYSGVYVSPGGNCGCTVGVGVRWISG